MNIIPSEKHWRVSMSGYSVKEGYMDNVRIVCKYPGHPTDYVAFRKWLEDAEEMCERHNAALEKEVLPISKKQESE